MHTGYPVGRHLLDLVVAGAEDVAVMTDVHPDGPAAHLELQLELLRLGWTVHERYRSRWDHRPGEAVVDLLGLLAAPGGHPFDRRPDLLN